MPEEKEFSVKEALEIAVGAHKMKNFQRAEYIYKKILEKFPNQADALHLLGLIEHQKGNHVGAVEKIKSAIAISPNFLFNFNLANIYDFLKEEDKSAECYQKALELNPNHENAFLSHYNLGIYFKDRGEIEKALFHYNKSLELNPNFADAHWNKSLILLLLENFKEGFEEYEFRFKKTSPTDSRIFTKPKLEEKDLENLKDKKILVLSEQGFGDAIQFVRYLPLLKEKGAYLILECKKELIELFRNSPEVKADEIIKKQSQIPSIKHDFYIHLMSLPKLFSTNLNNIPNKVPYLKADENLAKRLKEKIKELNSSKFKIGICWHGNPLQENDKNRSMPFEKFKILEEIPQVQLFSLQKSTSQLNRPDNSKITNLADSINDFSDTAALIENMDLIISVDTSIAHLSGALNKPCWTLLTKTPDWRWLLNRSDCPWYASMRLFRQKILGDWDNLMKEVKDELIKNLDGK